MTQEEFNLEFQKDICSCFVHGGIEWRKHIVQNLHRLTTEALQFMLAQRTKNRYCWNDEIIKKVEDIISDRVDEVLLSG